MTNLKSCGCLIVILILSFTSVKAQSYVSVYNLQIAKLVNPEIEAFLKEGVVPFAKHLDFSKKYDNIIIKPYQDSKDTIYICLTFCPRDLADFNGYVCDIYGIPVFVDGSLDGVIARPLGKTTQISHHQLSLVELVSVCDDEIVWILGVDGNACYLLDVIDYALQLSSEYAHKNLIPLHEKLYDKRKVNCP